MKSVFKSLAFVLGAGALSCNEGYPRKITAHDMPAAVQAAFNSSYPRAEVRGCREQRQSGKMFYEISFMHNDEKIDATYGAEGEMLEIEKTIDPAFLPALAQSELAAAYENIKIERAEYVRRGERISFEVKIAVPENGASRRYEVIFAEDGRLLEEKTEKKKDH